MTLTLIMMCGNCGGYLLAKEENQTRTCPYCGRTVVVQKAKKVASAQNAYEASEILKQLKSSQSQNPRRL
jgi:predicted RNA-binding Zn-ribbon protein involved in translation (DUF1610 family)